MRLALLIVALFLGYFVGAVAQERAYTLAIGRIGGTDLELEGCYYQIGAGAMLALHPKGEPCVLARELVGRTGRLVFLLDPPVASPSR